MGGKRHASLEFHVIIKWGSNAIKIFPPPPTCQVILLVTNGVESFQIRGNAVLFICGLKHSTCYSYGIQLLYIDLDIEGYYESQYMLITIAYMHENYS